MCVQYICVAVCLCMLYVAMYMDLTKLASMHTIARYAFHHDTIAVHINKPTSHTGIITES